MSEQATFLLFEIFDGLDVRETLTFRAACEIDVARYLCEHWWEHRDVFDVLRVRPKDVPTTSPEELLLRIKDSPRIGRHNSVLYLLRVPEQAIEIPPCAEPPPAVRNSAPTREAVSPESADASRG